MAALLLLERLSPLERAVFVLREVFGFDFAEIASAVERSEAACRQLAVRARRHMEAGRPGSRPTGASARSWPRGSSTRSGKATSTALQELLAADVQMVGDGGGKAPQWAADASSAPDKVARLLAATGTVVRRRSARRSSRTR